MHKPRTETISLAEFLAWEETQEQKHELVLGHVIPFSGHSFDHNDISLNACKLLDDRVQPPCKAHNSHTIIETLANKGENGLRADAGISCSPEDAGKSRFMK